MEADVGERSHTRRVDRRAGHVVQAERDAVRRQQRERLRLVPRRMPELDRVLQRQIGRAVGVDGPRQRGEEALEPRQVALEARRQLIEHRAETRTEAAGPLEQPRDRLLGIGEPLQVGEIAARLDRHDEPVGRLCLPARERLARRQAIERRVRLDGVEVREIEGEPLRGREPGRVEPAAPALVVPARAPDAQPRHRRRLSARGTDADGPRR